MKKNKLILAVSVFLLLAFVVQYGPYWASFLFFDIEKQGENQEIKNLEVKETIRQFKVCDYSISFFLPHKLFCNDYFIVDNKKRIFNSSLEFLDEVSNHSPPYIAV